MDQAVDAPPRPLELGLAWRNSFAGLGPAFFTELEPAPLPSPYLVGFNRPLADELGLAGRPGGGAARGEIVEQLAQASALPERAPGPHARHFGGEGLLASGSATACPVAPRLGQVPPPHVTVVGVTPV